MEVGVAFIQRMRPCLVARENTVKRDLLSVKRDLLSSSSEREHGAVARVLESPVHEPLLSRTPPPPVARSGPASTSFIAMNLLHSKLPPPLLILLLLLPPPPTVWCPQTSKSQRHITCRKKRIVRMVAFQPGQGSLDADPGLLDRSFHLPTHEKPSTSRHPSSRLHPRHLRARPRRTARA